MIIKDGEVEDIEYRLGGEPVVAEMRIQKRHKAEQEMVSSGLFSEDEINRCEFFLETWLCFDGHFHTGFSPNKTGEMIGVTGETVRRWTKKGKVKCFHTLGGFILIPYEEVIRLKYEKSA